MTKSKRIILNTLATYGRSVFAMFAGLFSSRWLLQGLGAQDLGLSCVVGSLIGALVIFETVMQVAVARFYAFAIVDMPILSYLKHIILPIISLSLISYAAALGVTHCLPLSFWRICLTTALSLSVMAVTIWLMLFDVEERQWVRRLVKMERGKA